MDWTRWVDQERKAAEDRVGSMETGDLLDDARYVEVLETWNRHRELSDERERVRRALVEVEDNARRLQQAAVATS